MTPDEKVPCRGLSALFDSTDKSDHIEARALCGSCPASSFMACERVLADVVDEWGYSRSHGPRGTWAGRLLAPETVGGLLPEQRAKLDKGPRHPKRRDKVA